MKKHLLLITSFLLAVIFVSCSKDEEDDILTPTPTEVIIRTNLPADTTGVTGKYTFFRFRDNAVLTTADSNTTNWDIAFRTTTIRVNGGTSGPGSATAIVLKETSFDAVTTAPDTGYAADTAAKLAIPTGSGNGWYNHNPALNIITPIPGVVLVVKTTDNKYVKVEILSYYKDAPTSPTSADTARFYKFKYFYQADGSKNLK